ncbi:VOC family protein [uncultured Hymenobacter sp.]|uniref:VOC family protein n=1 Tax=uncultured Hymenobacter sp. TaxID=170016 RepID=UPI0035C998C1
MRIEHVALWTTDLERARQFYVTYFGAASGEQHHNPVKHFTFHCLCFASGARLELMHRPALHPTADEAAPQVGYAHLAFATGSPVAVDTLTERLRAEGYAVLGAPRTTGNGYYESVVADPDSNLVKITV